MKDWDISLHAREGTRFVTRDEFQHGKDKYLPHAGLVKPLIADALVLAADAEGMLADFDVRAFYTSHVQQALHNELDDDEQAPRLSYDTFTAMALQEALHGLLLDDGLLAHRGKGGSYDYRLTLPHTGEAAG